MSKWADLFRSKHQEASRAAEEHSRQLEVLKEQEREKRRQAAANLYRIRDNLETIPEIRSLRFEYRISPGSMDINLNIMGAGVYPVAEVCEGDNKFYYIYHTGTMYESDYRAHQEVYGHSVEDAMPKIIEKVAFSLSLRGITFKK
jgi:hypothetical protein